MMFKKIFLSIHLLISLALFLITLIKDYNYQFQLVNYYQNYYFISLILITFSIIIFFFSNELIKIYFISIITVLSTLYAAEFFYFKKHDYESKFSSNYLFQKKNNPNLIKQFPYDKKNSLEKYEELKKKYEIYPEITKIFINDGKKKIYILNSISNSKILSCNENGYYPIVEFDKYGFINDNVGWNKKKNLVIVGDSWMATSCLSYENGVAGQFKNKLYKKKSDLFPITISKGNNGPLIQLATLKEYINQLSPKIILWVYYDGNDFSDLNRELKNKTLKKYLYEDEFSQKLISKQKIIDKALKLKIKNKKYINEIYNIDNYSIIKFIKLSRLRLVIALSLRSKSINNKKNFDVFKKIILKAKNITEINGSKFYFVYLPDTWDINDKTEINDKNYNLIFDFLKKEQIKLIDFNVELKNHPDPRSLLPFRTNGHFNKKGVEFFVDKTIKELF